MNYGVPCGKNGISIGLSGIITVITFDYFDDRRAEWSGQQAEQVFHNVPRFPCQSATFPAAILSALTA